MNITTLAWHMRILLGILAYFHYWIDANTNMAGDETDGSLQYFDTGHHTYSSKAVFQSSVQNPVHRGKIRSGGISNFPVFVTRSPEEYVDKTLFIRDVIEEGWGLALLTRPRRFGKSLLMSTCETFFSDRKAHHRHLFFENKLKITEKTEALNQFRDNHMNRYSVIHLSFSSAKGLNFETAKIQIKQTINAVFRAHDYLLDEPKMSNTRKELFRSYIMGTADDTMYADSLTFLSECFTLRNNGTSNTIILLDEYDTPIYSGYDNGYYDEMMNFLRPLFLKTLKENPDLTKSVITGVTRIGQESLFSDLNNVCAYTVFDDQFSEYIGFTEKEMIKQVVTQGRDKATEDFIRERFNGYHFGNRLIYNPYAVAMYLYRNATDGWIKTGSETMLRSLIKDNGLYPILTLQQLLVGEPVIKVLADNLIYPQIKSIEMNYWTYLLNLGYFSAVVLDRSKVQVTTNYSYTAVTAQLSIPNDEVRDQLHHIIYGNDPQTKIPDYQHMVTNLINGNFAEAQAAISTYVKDAGKYFQQWGQDVSLDKFADYIIQMLRGVERQYKTKMTVTTQGREVTIEVKPPKNSNGWPVHVKIVKTSTTKLAWLKIKNQICNTLRNLNETQTAIVIHYGRFFADVCLQALFGMKP